MRRSFAAACLLGLAACAAPPPYAGTDAGWLLGSMGFGVPNAYTDLEFYFRRKSDGGSGSLRIPPKSAASASKIEIKGEGGRAVQVFAVPLPPGDYEFFTYLGYAPGSGDTNHARPKVDFRIPFTIAAGRTTYVGEYIVDSRPQMRSTGRLVAEARFVVADRLERDLAAARDAGRPVGTATAAIAVPDVRRLNLPNFDAREP